VTLRDIIAIGRRIVRGPFDAAYDINGDGRITTRDLRLAVRQVGHRCGG
jgi:hypothetical protein